MPLPPCLTVFAVFLPVHVCVLLRMQVSLVADVITCRASVLEQHCNGGDMTPDFVRWLCLIVLLRCFVVCPCCRWRVALPFACGGMLLGVVA